MITSHPLQKHYIAGIRFNRLVASHHIGRGKWSCLCDCGNACVFRAGDLVKNRYSSCGCLKRDASENRKASLVARKESAVSPERLKALISYDAGTGVFSWIVSPRFSVDVGRVCHPSKNGYVYIRIDDRSYFAHRLAWFYVYGHWPIGTIDHINGNRSDNRLENLRDVSSRANTQNRRSPSKSNSTGFLGVTANGSIANPYRAQITFGNKVIYIGIFPTPELAYEAYVTKKREIHEGCTL